MDYRVSNENSEQLIRERLSDPWWRLNNLYYIVDERGRRVRFTCNWAQEQLYRDMWYLNLILKARQLGMTTLIQIFMLDRCLFNKNVSAGVIAHNREDAEDFFSKKIKYAYDNLPDWLRAAIPTEGDSAKQLAFTNGSSIRVGTSLRSGTYQYLHISEFGKICAKYPEKAQEIISGSLNTVHAGQFVFIESTAEGAYGHFHDMCQTALRHKGGLSQLDYKMFFFPWYQHPSYVLDGVEIPQGDEEYFASLERQGIELTATQKGWYSKKKVVQKGLMKQEYPSTPQEAFMRLSEHAIYGKEMRAVREEGRIGKYPYVPGKPVYTFWDIGRSKTDQTSIWFMQHIDGRKRFIDYESGVMQEVAYYAKKLQEKPYVYGRHHLPHDADHNDYTLKTYKKHMYELGVKDIEIVARIPHLNEGIRLTRDMLPTCEFDEERCAEGILALESYRYEYDEDMGTYTRPRHDWASHPADAIRQCAQGFRSGGWKTELGKPGPVHAGVFSRSRGRAIKTNTSWMV